MIIRSKNIQHLSAQGKTFLTAAGTVGQTTFTVKNIAGLEDNLAIQFGEVGQEYSEVVLTNGVPAGGTLITSAISYPHATDTPVYCYRFNQAVFMRSDAGTAGTATPITNGTVTLTPDSEFTIFDDTAATAGAAWKVKFRNSALATESPESDWITDDGEVGGFKAYQLGGLRDRVREKILSPDIKDSHIDNWLNEWRQEMVNAAIEVNEDYSMGTVDVTFSGTASEGTITAEDFVKPRRVWLTNDAGEFRRATRADYNEAYPDQVFNQEQPRYYFRGDDVIGRLPADSSGTARIAYDSIGEPMTNDGDKLPLSMRGYSKSFIDYALSQAYRHPSINLLTDADKLEKSAYNQREDFVTKISPRQTTNQEYVQIVESEGLEEELIDW